MEGKKSDAKKIRKVLVIGSGPIKIAEAAEFDYSANQALKALREEGIETIIMSPNIATVQTDSAMADKVYMLPLTSEFAERIISKEKPDGIMVGFGGQSALNIGIDLYRKGILKRHGVNVLGTHIEGIETALSRREFKKVMQDNMLPIPPGGAARNREEAERIAESVGYPIMLRVSFNLGGRGSFIAHNRDEIKKNFDRAIAQSRTGEVLIEKYLQNWKEVEYEIVRDGDGNGIAVACLENIDPMGVHTGDSVVVAPAQTLNNEEYQAMRRAAIKVAECIGLVGECNVQFALDPNSSNFYIIETNPRMSRSSALASKATGYPLAYIAAKIALGKKLHELKNSISNATSAFFEPSLDYIVVKMPRWDFKKFDIRTGLGTEMRSTGEVMAIGRNIEEALLKGFDMLGLGHMVKEAIKSPVSKGNAIKALMERRPYWFIDVIRAHASGIDNKKISAITGIDPFFVDKIVGISTYRNSNARFVKQIDTLAGEYKANMNYLYTTGIGSSDDISFGSRRKKLLVLGAGAFRIGVSVEFDYASVLLAKAARKKFEVSILNFNPETVSTDWDIADKLYFDTINEKTIVELNRKEKFDYVATFAAGQLGNDIAAKLDSNGMKLLGSGAKSIEKAENRKEFAKLLEKLGIQQPDWISAESIGEVKAFAREHGFPILVRPSHVLSGTSMRVATNEAELMEFIHNVPYLSRKYPVVLSKFFEDSIEAEIDGVADGRAAIGTVITHIEEAGVHSGDSTMVLPTSAGYAKPMKEIALQLVGELGIKGPFNLQFVVKDGKPNIIELNLRASRSMPFSSKASGLNLVEKALEGSLGRFGFDKFIEPKYKGITVKSPQFSWLQMPGAYPSLGPEMKSTGESGAFGASIEEALLKSWLGAQPNRMPDKQVLIYGASRLLEEAVPLYGSVVKVLTLKGQYSVNASEISVEDALDMIRQGKLDMIVTHGDIRSFDFRVRRLAVDMNVPLVLNARLGVALGKSISLYKSIANIAKHV